MFTTLIAFSATAFVVLAFAFFTTTAPFSPGDRASTVAEQIAEVATCSGVASCVAFPPARRFQGLGIASGGERGCERACVPARTRSARTKRSSSPRQFAISIRIHFHRNFEAEGRPTSASNTAKPQRVPTLVTWSLC
ncbi:hypothetical protein Ae201684P_000447 [Aphanomyces euteiches]|nr:hypothetical protein Ae201684P_000447 [Aphanomyces euteiches]